jgi:hypothetical protein
VSKEEEFDVLHQLEAIANDAGKVIDDEWKALQMRLMQESRVISQNLFQDQGEAVSAVLCVGYQIDKEQFDADDGVEQIGPKGSEYPTSGANSGYARMTPAVGVKLPGEMYKFLSDKTLVCSLYEVTNYVSLFMHVKYKQSELIAMTTPAGIAITLEPKNGEAVQFYLKFDIIDKDIAKETLAKLSDKQREVIMELCEAQMIAPELKAKHPKMWNLMIEAIKENGSNAFLNGDDTEGDE